MSKLNRNLRILSLVLFIVTIIATAENPCINHSGCHCELKNGSIINLMSIGLANHNAKFPNLTLDKENNVSFSYNPCFPFTDSFDGSEECKDVAGCRRKVHTESGRFFLESFSFGKQETAFFTSVGDKMFLTYYKNTTIDEVRKLEVELVCNLKMTSPTIINRSNVNETEEVLLTLTSNCACADACTGNNNIEPSAGLSPGTIFLILFLVLSFIYMCGGMVYNKIVLGAHGMEIFPHLEFWVSIPGLALDGLRFLFSCCQPRQKVRQYDGI